MSLDRIRRSSLGLLVAALLAFTPLTFVAQATEIAERSPTEVENDESVQEQIDKQLAERRQAMLKEAHDALDETRAALVALDAGNTREALDALARATGKLELLVARDPDLALAPVDVRFVTHDVYATPQEIRSARKQAEELLGDGKVQEARRLLSGLASEIVISVTNLPLATYPAAIKAVSPLIDKGEIKEAKAALGVALNTLVVTNQVVSLPVLRAHAALGEAEAMLETETLADDDMKRVDALIENARNQLEIAELLGYGSKADYKQYRKEIADLVAKIRTDEEASGLLARLRTRLGEFQGSFLE